MGADVLASPGGRLALLIRGEFRLDNALQLSNSDGKVTMSTHWD